MHVVRFICMILQHLRQTVLMDSRDKCTGSKSAVNLITPVMR